MKNKKGIVIGAGVLMAILVTYVSLVAVDCWRFKSLPHGTKPLICVNEEVEEYSQEYYGLGYHVRYYEDAKEYPSGDVAIGGEGVEIYLFGNMIWCWEWH